FFSSRRRHTRFSRDWSSDVCSSDLLIRTIWSGYPYIIIHSSCAKIRTRYTVAKGHFCGERSCPDTTIHKDSVSVEQGFKFFKCFGKVFKEFMNSVPYVL